MSIVSQYFSHLGSPFFHVIVFFEDEEDFPSKVAVFILCEVPDSDYSSRPKNLNACRFEEVFVTSMVPLLHHYQGHS